MVFIRGLCAALMVALGAQSVGANGAQAHMQGMRAVQVVTGDHRMGSVGRANCRMASESEARQGLRRHNAARTGKGLAPMRVNPVLSRLAAEHACDMAQRGMVSHRSGGGHSAGQRARRAGYDWQAIAENIGAGANSLAEVVAAWHGSPTHLANIIDGRMLEFGIGRAQAADGRVYWAAVYAAPRRR